MVQVIDYFLKGTIFVVWMREVKVDRIYTCEIFFFCYCNSGRTMTQLPMSHRYYIIEVKIRQIGIIVIDSKFVL